MAVRAGQTARDKAKVRRECLACQDLAVRAGLADFLHYREANPARVFPVDRAALAFRQAPVVVAAARRAARVPAAGQECQAEAPLEVVASEGEISAGAALAAAAEAPEAVPVDRQEVIPAAPTMATAKEGAVVVNKVGSSSPQPSPNERGRRETPARRLSRRGLVLVLVLIVVVLLSLGAYSFTDLMLAHHEAAQLTGRQVQTRALVDTGIQAVRVFLSQPDELRQEAGGTFDNPERFQGVTVIDDDDPNLRGSFAVLAPNLDSDGNLAGVRYGLEDESTRLNLNTLLAAEQTLEGSGKTFLMALPGMTEDVAEAILDWLDADDEPRELGAEIDYYSGLSPAYAPKNGPLETVEELLLVRGITPQLLFGADANRNGQLDPHEMGEEGTGGSIDPAAFRGWSAYLTLYSLEWNVNPDGRPRIYLNTMNLQQLHTDLSAVFPPAWVTFIIAYRQAGPFNAITTSGQNNVSGTLDLNKQARTPIGSVLDLVGAKVNYTFVGADSATVINSPFGPEIGAMNIYMPMLMDQVTVNPSLTIPGRININQAPATILAGIPGMQPDMLSQILSRRDVDVSDKPNRRHESWLLQEGVLTLDEMKLMLPFMTAGGDIFRAQVVGYFQGGEAASRAEVVFDATRTMPRLLFWRDISHLGRGYALETLGVDYSE